jgi:hypothetical protein
MQLKPATSLAMLLLMIAGRVAAAQDEATPESLAVAAAQSWLALVDEGGYAESWATAATAFHEQVTREEWEVAMLTHRTPLGDLESRELLGAQYTSSLPGAPPGEYVVLQFRTNFGAKPAAVETVVPVKEEDGTWKVSGYFIR